MTATKIKARMTTHQKMQIASEFEKNIKIKKQPGANNSEPSVFCTWDVFIEGEKVGEIERTTDFIGHARKKHLFFRPTKNNAYGMTKERKSVENKINDLKTRIAFDCIS